MTGNSGADSLYGQGGSDALDSLDGVSGNDTLDGGSGTDTKVTEKQRTRSWDSHSSWGRREWIKLTTCKGRRETRGVDLCGYSGHGFAVERR